MTSVTAISLTQVKPTSHMAQTLRPFLFSLPGFYKANIKNIYESWQPSIRSAWNYVGKTFKFVQQGRSKYHELAAAILKGKMSYPSTAFFNAEQQLVQTVPGYLTEQRFEKILAYFSGGHYNSTPWADFEKNFKSSL